MTIKILWDRIQWFTPVVPALWEVKVGGSPEIRGSRPDQPGQYSETQSILKTQKFTRYGGVHL